MNIRTFQLSDLVDLERRSKFPLENLNLGSDKTIIKRSIYSGNQLLGSFFVHNTAEISLILDSDMSNISKSKALINIFNDLKNDLSSQNYDDAHVFIKDHPEYVDILKDHFGFEDVIGTPLVVRKSSHG